MNPHQCSCMVLGMTWHEARRESELRTEPPCGASPIASKTDGLGTSAEYEVLASGRDALSVRLSIEHAVHGRCIDVLARGH